MITKVGWTHQGGPQSLVDTVSSTVHIIDCTCAACTKNRKVAEFILVHTLTNEMLDAGLSAEQIEARIDLLVGCVRNWRNN
jgi:hypothetical protein